MANGFSDRVLGAAGFGLCKAAISVAYITAMGSVSSSVGFVSELDFMFTMNAASFVTAFAVLLLVGTGRLRPGRLSQVPAVIALLVGFFLSATGVMTGLPVGATAALYGLLCGFALTVLNAAWLEVFAAESDATTGVCQVLGGLVVQCALVSVAPLLASFAASVLSIVAVATSALLLSRLKRKVAFPERAPLLPERSDERFRLLQACLCLFVLVGVVGILHTTVLGSQSEHIVGDVNMWMPLVAATMLTAVVAGLTMRHPDPTAVYKGCLPVMLVLLSLLPFFGEVLGGLAGLVMITCYDVCGMVFLLFIVDRARALGVSVYALSSVYSGGSGLFLAVGLGIGNALGALSADYGLSLLTLLAFAAIYPLALVLLVVLRRVYPAGAAGSRAEGGEPVGVAQVEGVGRASAVARGAGAGEVRAAAGADGERRASAWASAGDCAGEGRLRSADAGADAQAAVGVAASTGEASSDLLRAKIEPGVAPVVEDVLAAGADAVAARFDLTRREREILGYLARGRSARFIAETLVISENTAWAHIKRIYAKTGVHSKQELMSMVERRAGEGAGR